MHITANHNKTFDEKTEFFGFFETIDDYVVASKLLDAAGKWVKSKGMVFCGGQLIFHQMMIGGCCWTVMICLPCF